MTQQIKLKPYQQMQQNLTKNLKLEEYENNKNYFGIDKKFKDNEGKEIFYKYFKELKYNQLNLDINQHLYEILCGSYRLCNFTLYFDIDFKVFDSSLINQEELIKKFMKDLEEYFGFKIEWSLLNSTKKDKISFHITCNNIQFNINEKVIEEIKIQLKEKQQNDKIIMKIIFKSYKLFITELIKNIIQKQGNSSIYRQFLSGIDLSVYSQSRQFRMIYQSKLDKQECLIPFLQDELEHTEYLLTKIYNENNCILNEKLQHFYQESIQYYKHQINNKQELDQVLENKKIVISERDPPKITEIKQEKIIKQKQLKIVQCPQLQQKGQDLLNILTAIYDKSNIKLQQKIQKMMQKQNIRRKIRYILQQLMINEIITTDFAQELYLYLTSLCETYIKTEEEQLQKLFSFSQKTCNIKCILKFFMYLEQQKDQIQNKEDVKLQYLRLQNQYNKENCEEYQYYQQQINQLLLNDYEIDEQFNQYFKYERFNKQVQFILSLMNTGKTFGFSDYQKLFHQDDDIFYILPKTSTSKYVYQQLLKQQEEGQFEGYTILYYKNEDFINPDIQLSAVSQDKIIFICCVESIEKVIKIQQLRRKQYVFVLDEVTETINMQNNINFLPKKKIQNQLILTKLTHNLLCSKVLCLDAFLSEEYIKQILNYLNFDKKQAIIQINKFNSLKDIQFDICNKNNFVHRFLDTVSNKRNFIFCSDNKSKIITFYDMLDEETQKKTIILVSDNTDIEFRFQQQKNEFLEDPEYFFNNGYNIMFSPVLCSTTSWNYEILKKYDNFCYANFNAEDQQFLFQQILRNRQIKQVYIKICYKYQQNYAMLQYIKQYQLYEFLECQNVKIQEEIKEVYKIHKAEYNTDLEILEINNKVIGLLNEKQIVNTDTIYNIKQNFFSNKNLQFKSDCDIYTKQIDQIYINICELKNIANILEIDMKGYITKEKYYNLNQNQLDTLISKNLFLNMQNVDKELVFQEDQIYQKLYKNLEKLEDNSKFSEKQKQQYKVKTDKIRDQRIKYIKEIIEHINFIKKIEQQTEFKTIEELGVEPQFVTQFCKKYPELLLKEEKQIQKNGIRQRYFLYSINKLALQ